jgi:hypothetical protein
MAKRGGNLTPFLDYCKLFYVKTPVLFKKVMLYFNILCCLWRYFRTSHVNLEHDCRSKSMQLTNLQEITMHHHAMMERGRNWNNNKKKKKIKKKSRDSWQLRHRDSLQLNASFRVRDAIPWWLDVIPNWPHLPLEVQFRIPHTLTHLIQKNSAEPSDREILYQSITEHIYYDLWKKGMLDNELFL